MRTDPMSDSSYNFSYVSNENESYFLYSIHDSSTITKLFMYVSGQIEQMTWLESRKQWNLFYAAQPIQQCEVYAFCGAFGICNDKSQPFCSCLTGFQPTSQQNWSQQMADTNMECKSTCLENCSCTAYAFENNRCSIWIGDLLNLQQLGQDYTTWKVLYIKLEASEISNEPSPTDESGTLPDGSIIAVKKRESINQGEKQFHAEAGTIGKINHVNLIRLRGFQEVACWCIQDHEIKKPSMGQVVQIL
ncbi:hypothetical protein V6N12_060414 [Hibiscus sabdariffa]|uniref:Apple domain-containing protein n=1 Tax=Hibiscus sabdariffa TaxID=183260 RepID=A0ABR2D4C7_9ROSI